MSQKGTTQTTKRDKFEQAGRRPWGKVIAVGVAAVILVAGGLVLGSKLGASKAAGGPVVKTDVQFAAGPQKMVAMTSSKVAGGNLTVSLAEITASPIGTFSYDRTAPMPNGFNAQGNKLTLLSYVAPSGRLVVATAMCEPCRSTVFHIEGKQLVCDTCYTRWDLNTLKGVSGGCTAYPPSEVTATVQGDTVTIPVAALEAWAPRI
jgi:hypothetical protein